MKMLIKGLLISAIVVVLDQLSKFYILKKLHGLERPVIEITPFFNIVEVYNYGVSFGMFRTMPYGWIILSAIALSITFALCFWLIKVKKLYMCIALGLIIGGAVGNTIDRLRFGAVADFLDFYIGNYHWPAFNIADSAVCLGVFIVFIDSFMFKKKEG